MIGSSNLLSNNSSAIIALAVVSELRHVSVTEVDERLLLRLSHEYVIYCHTHLTVLDELRAENLSDVPLRDGSREADDRALRDMS